MNLAWMLAVTTFASPWLHQLHGHSTNHKAGFETIEGECYWYKHCNSDREAWMLRDGDRKTSKQYAKAYRGGGWAYSLDGLISSVVFTTCSPEMVAGMFGRNERESGNTKGSGPISGEFI